MNFKTFFEGKTSNPLRKQKHIDDGGWIPPDPDNRRLKIDETYHKIYEYRGVQVFLDKFVTQKFEPNSLNLRTIKFGVNNLLNEMRGIIPNKNPRIIITDISKNPHVGSNMTRGKSNAFYYDRLIWIDQMYIDEYNLWWHEAAHYVADLVPTQTMPLLLKAYKELLDLYYKKVKKKSRLNLEPENPKLYSSVLEAENWRKKISKKIGFPEYGLMNESEFFAVLIENWKYFPNNKQSYKFKQLVKSVLARL